jgi:hypothetical protein
VADARIATTLTGHTLINTTLTGTFLPSVAATVAGGSNALPFSNWFIGASANHSISFDTSALSTNRVVTVGDGASVVPQAITASANNFLTGISGTTGVFTRSQPNFTNISGGLACSQMPALTGVITTSAGSCATSGAAITLQTNTSNNSSQSLLNFTNTSGASGLTWTNPSGGVQSASLANVTGGGTATLQGTITSPADGQIIGYSGSVLVNISPISYVTLNAFDFGTTVTTGDGAYYFTVPAGLNGKSLVSVSGSVILVGTTSTTDVQLARCAVVATGNQCSGTVVDMLSTALTIDSNENKSSTAATPVVINGANALLATDQQIRVDVDAVSTTPPTGLIITLGIQ